MEPSDPALKLSRSPRSFAATLEALPSISEIPFLDSCVPDSCVPGFLASRLSLLTSALGCWMFLLRVRYGETGERLPRRSFRRRRVGRFLPGALRRSHFVSNRPEIVK